MPDDRAASEAARRQKSTARRGAAASSAQSAPQPVPRRRITPLKIVGWASYLVTIVLFTVFAVLWVHNQVPQSQILYPLPGIASVFLIVGVWTILGPSLYPSRSTATRAGKYVLAILATIIFYPLVVTGVSSLAQWIVSLIPGSPLH